ncbi:hypothetical protein VHEMI07134 [[Torrubiella] hemipterigena]|uniref:Cytochrome c oxidase assembly protein n=1 Tax=[Torrubiella] hemipterigena TaxID=1531966 RepID=A0A0A1TL34_9HYPO|nr:hypothetical protein VHEMI07134 [[Torrubiella] hemipterigena]
MPIGANLTPRQKVNRGVWAAAFGAVICVGALTGAQLKSDEQKTQAIKQFRQTTPADQISILEDQKKHLLQQKAGLERKVQMFQLRVKEREAKKEKSEKSS